jgi:hypothetical protein
MAAKSPKNLLGIPKRSSGKDLGYQKNQNLVAAHEFSGQNPQVRRVKTDGRIGSVTPPDYLRGGLTVDTNAKASPSKGLGAQAAKHMNANHEGGDVWSPRVAKARATANAGRAAKSRPHTNPINVQKSGLKRVKPD